MREAWLQTVNLPSLSVCDVRFGRHESGKCGGNVISYLYGIDSPLSNRGGGCVREEVRREFSVRVDRSEANGRE